MPEQKIKKSFTFLHRCCRSVKNNTFAQRKKGWKTSYTPVEHQRNTL